MGLYTAYIDQNLSFEEITAERKKQLAEISRLRGGRDVLVFAADLNKEIGQISIGYSDLLPINDQLSNLNGNKIDLILETPGGSGEVAEDIVELLRNKYEEVGIIIPGWAKSAGTIIAMSGDEILMGPLSGLGPIDAQITWQGKRFSAQALIEGMNKIKDEVSQTGTLNKAYIPILQGISPGELQNAQNAFDFAKVLVTEWLEKYKFKNWTTHSSNGQPVTPDERKQRAQEIAEKLCNHNHWLTHGRSIKIEDLEEMRLKITNYAENSELEAAINKYFTLLEMSFAQTTIYKVFETTSSQIYRFIAQNIPTTTKQQDAKSVIIDITCQRCKTLSKVQGNLEAGQPLQPSTLPFPPDNKLKCPSCDLEIDLSAIKNQIEAQTKKQIIT
jgi:hypothetical protein